MLTIILLIATIFIPGNRNRNAVASIGILGILLLFLSILLPKIHKLTLNLLKNQEKPDSLSFLNHDPATAYEKLTGTYDEKVSENTVYEELFFQFFYPV